MTLDIKGLRFSREQFTLGPLDLRVEAGRRTVLLGPSGCGKTTLLRLVAGLERPEAGTISFDGETFSGAGRELAPERRGVAMVFQNLALWPHLPAWRQLAFAGGSTRAEAEALLARVGMADKAERLPGELSGGEGQRVALARALAQRPRLLLLDEPLRSVDPHLREGLARLFVAVGEETGLTMLFVTHDREEAMRLGQELVLLEAGRLVEQGTPGELQERPRTAFGARFLQGAALLDLDGEHAALARELCGPTVELPQGSTNGHVDLLALTPHDLVAGDEGLACQVVEVFRAAQGPVAEAVVGGQRLRFAVGPDTRPGQEVRLRLRGAPRFVRGRKEDIGA
ncbi:MAG: ABC transporter ATP-binding protein [Planctomycetota bacterium]